MKQSDYLSAWTDHFAELAANEGWKIVEYQDGRANFIQLKAIVGGSFLDDGAAWLHIFSSSEIHHLKALQIVRNHCQSEFLNILVYTRHFSTQALKAA